MMSGEEDAISLSDPESEGEGPNIRPPQPAGGGGQVRHHREKQKQAKRGWDRQAGRGGERFGGREGRDFEGRQDRRPKDHRNRKHSRSNERRRKKSESRNDRKRERDWGRQERGQDGGHGPGDLRNRLGGRDRGDRYDRDHRREYERGGREERQGRDEDGGHRRDRRDEVPHEGNPDRQAVEARMSKFIQANRHMEETRRNVEVRKKRKLIEKEIERLKNAADKKRRKERSHSKEKRKKKRKKSESESGEEEENEDMEDEDLGEDDREEEDKLEGSESDEESEEEDVSESEGAASDATTGSQKSGSTPQSPSYEESEEEEGEIEDEEEEERKGEKLKKGLSKSPSLSPNKVEGKWGEKQADETPERSPTPMRDTNDDGDNTPHDSQHDSPVSRSDSPPPTAEGTEMMDSSPAHVKPEDTLPPYLPSVHGCRSVAEFKCLNRIEEGTYGVVYRARDKRTQEIVALKRLKMEREKEGFPITSLREINTILISQHPNVVTVREIVVGSNMDQIYIVMDFVHHDLKELMETMRKKSQVFLPGEIKCLMIQLLRAIHHLHDNWILHRDVKASNLLLSHNGVLKVGDFGLAREYGSPLRPYTPIVVTLWYRAPELLLGIKEYSTHIDVWSVGCIFGELLLMEPLFPGKSEVDQLNRIFKLLGTPSEKIWPGYKELPAVQKMKFVDYPISHLRNKFPEKMLTETGLILLKKLLTYDPKRRVSCEEALRDEYFKEAPGPIDPSMFPTWPAKSEQEPGDRNKQASPPPPSGGGAYKKISQDDKEDDETRARGFSLIESVKNKPVVAGWNLKF